MRDVIIGFRAALLATVLEALGRFICGGPYLPELTAEKFFSLIPVWAFTPLFRTFGYNSKYYAFGGMIAAEVAGLTVLGIVLRAWIRQRRRAGWSAPWVVAATASPIAVAILLGLLPLLDAGIAGQELTAGAWTTVSSVVVVSGCYATVLTLGTSA